MFVAESHSGDTLGASCPRDVHELAGARREAARPYGLRRFRLWLCCACLASRVTSEAASSKRRAAGQVASRWRQPHRAGRRDDWSPPEGSGGGVAERATHPRQQGRSQYWRRSTSFTGHSSPAPNRRARRNAGAHASPAMSPRLYVMPVLVDRAWHFAKETRPMAPGDRKIESVTERSPISSSPLRSSPPPPGRYITIR